MAAVHFLRWLKYSQRNRQGVEGWSNRERGREGKRVRSSRTRRTQKKGEKWFGKKPAIMDIVPFFVFLTWLAGWLAGRLVGFLVWWSFFHFLHWHHPPNPPHPRPLVILYIPHPPTHIHTPTHSLTPTRPPTHALTPTHPPTQDHFPACKNEIRMKCVPL